jgi:hypothetical protein
MSDRKLPLVRLEEVIARLVPESFIVIFQLNKEFFRGR